jgi:hypothetical protein
MGLLGKILDLAECDGSIGQKYIVGGTGQKSTAG